MKSRTWLPWLIAAVVVLAIALAIGRALTARRAQQQSVEDAARSAQAAPLVELSAADLLRAQPQELVLGLPLSGGLRAVQSAVVKARVAGELRSLTVREGDTVRAGQQLARIDPTEYAARERQARQQADAARAQRDIAQRQLANHQALIQQGFISKTALDTAQANLDAARASHEAALAAAEVARKALADTELKAPISGQVAQRLAQPGERVAIDTRVLELVDLSKMELEAALSPSDAGSVRVGQTAALQVEGLSEPVAAKVVRINPSTQAGSRSVLVYLAMAGQPGLRQGLFAQGTLATGQLQTLAVPVSAVRTDQPLPYVQVVEQERIAHRPVTLGPRGQAQGQAMVAVSGLTPDAVVVAGSVGLLRAGTQVKFVSTAP